MSWIASLFVTLLLPSLSDLPQATGTGGSGAKRQDAEKQEKQDSKQKPEYRFKPMPIPKGIIEHRGTRKIKIDGSLDDWPRTVPIVLRDPRQVSGTALGAYRNATDISGQMYMLWDEKHLYVAVQVLDDWHRPLKKRASLRQEIPPVDNVLLTFDPRRDTQEIGDDPGRQDDRTFLLAELESIGDNLIEWNRRKATKNLTRGAHMVVDRRVKESVTIYELRIPWRAILPSGTSPKRRLVMDMQVVLNDYDEPMDTMPQTRVGWNFGMGPQIRPGLWGSVMLVGTFDPEKDSMPEFPPPPQVIRNAVPARDYWVGLHKTIRSTTPVFVGVSTPDPALVGGARRYKALMDLEGYLQTFPRLDNLEYHHRIQRRMVRETAGIRQHGLPFFWSFAFDDMFRRANVAPPKDVIRLFRLPQGGWYVRSDTVNFIIDPSGLDVEKLYLRGGIDFAVLTRPTEVTRRHEPLLIRMAASKPKRQFFTHLDFHLTGAKPGSMFMVKPFTDYLMVGLKRVTPIGRMTKDGKLTLSMGYLIEWKDGRTLVVAGLSIADAEIKKLGLKPDVLIVSGQHHEARDIASRIRARYTIIDDVLIAAEYPDQFGGRLKYQKALAIQNLMKPLRTLILAPGESVDIPTNK